MNYDKIMCVLTYYPNNIEPSTIKKGILLHLA